MESLQLFNNAVMKHMTFHQRSDETHAFKEYFCHYWKNTLLVLELPEVVADLFHNLEPDGFFPLV